MAPRSTRRLASLLLTVLRPERSHNAKCMLALLPRTPLDASSSPPSSPGASPREAQGVHQAGTAYPPRDPRCVGHLPDAYPIKLEQTVTMLQSVLALSPDQVAAIPPPLMGIHELEQENEQLHREVEKLRRQLKMKNGQLRANFRGDTPLPSDDRQFDRENKRRRARCGWRLHGRIAHIPGIMSLTGPSDLLQSQSTPSPVHPPSPPSPASTRRKALRIARTTQRTRRVLSTTTRTACRDTLCHWRLRRSARRRVPRFGECYLRLCGLCSPATPC